MKRRIMCLVVAGGCMLPLAGCHCSGPDAPVDSGGEVSCQHTSEGEG